MPANDRCDDPAPGRLVLVVGPSGAGKDTLIDAARRELAGDPRFAFPRRVVTRPPSPAEDNDTVDAEAFAAAQERGAFALAWTAHGHAYGIPAAIDADLARGATVVVNVSRTVVAAARARWHRVAVVEVTAPTEILAARIAARARGSDAAGAERLTRRLPNDAGLVPDHRVDNAGPLDEAVAAFLAALGSGTEGAPRP
ncbi:phosphonate metabolism protein/1,5-bisphosphokinase (PRPP-forming) PhnN [Siculibacillus lacustris]|uniref:Ribose 1,5-bisphosphate phosphokinase PhnN n=1 Tax=Siculibacillus lacustris TaxID=1549641 RepID=A0A4Q9VRD7_9HYPH|nr:phosphonate metabolism protein/1,5-bisphosphokinase (PRPP-forming) PhnN [Siculibacillus lacustris]TBW37597.1 phosphonate metabolism protein/1,5-bisphosphokinase (PRPP-forming) PhnN [Siculibacillus lacustris]